MIINAKKRRSIIERFPEEVHLLVLNSVKKTGSPGVLNKCMQCCRRWHRIGVQLLYEDIALTDQLITRKFCRDIHLVNRNLRNFLRNLTLSLNTLPISEIDHLYLIIRAIRYRSQLETLSLMVTNEHPSIPRLLRVLPQSVENLEISFRGSYSLNPKFHLCDEIRKCLTHVKRLRLRIGHICKNIFSSRDDYWKDETKFYSLRSITVISWQIQSSRLRWCTSGSGDTSGNGDAFPLFTLYARACWLKGMFPECKDFTAIGVSPEISRESSLLLHLYDVLRNRQSIFPITYMHGSSLRYVGSYVIKVAPKQLIYGNDYSLLPHIDDKSFSQTNFELRIPNALMARGKYVASKHRAREVGDFRDFQKKTREKEEDMRNLINKEITHGEPQFKCLKKYHLERREEAAHLLNTLGLHDK